MTLITNNPHITEAKDIIQKGKGQITASEKNAELVCLVTHDELIEKFNVLNSKKVNPTADFKSDNSRDIYSKNALAFKNAQTDCTDEARKKNLALAETFFRVLNFASRNDSVAGTIGADLCYRGILETITLAGLRD